MLRGCEDAGTVQKLPDKESSQPQTASETSDEHDKADPQENKIPPQATATLKPPLNSIFGLVARGEFESARQQIHAFLEENPNSGEAKFLLGLSYHRQKKYGLAKPYFKEAVELSPLFHPALHFQGWCLYYLGEIDDSYNAFKEHVKLSPKEGDSYFAMGLIEMELDQLDKAQRNFQTAIDLQKDNPRRVRDVAKIHTRLADIYIRNENFNQAQEELMQAIKLWPRHYIAYYKLHVVLNRLGKTQEAQEAYRQYKIGQAQAASRRGVPGQGQ